MSPIIPQKRRTTTFVAARCQQDGLRTAENLMAPSQIHIMSEAAGNVACSGHPQVAEGRTLKTDADGRNGSTHLKAWGISASNMGFKLLKKSGWKEGTGLGVAEQGIVTPLPTFVKHGREGIGAENGATTDIHRVLKKQKEVLVVPKRKASNAERQASKRAKKAHAEEQRMLEHEFTRNFLREFWPDNV